jgi:hypothetical protein
MLQSPEEFIPISSKILCFYGTCSQKPAFRSYSVRAWNFFSSGIITVNYSPKTVSYG